MKRILTIFLLLFTVLVNAQSIELTVVSKGGKTLDSVKYVFNVTQMVTPKEQSTGKTSFLYVNDNKNLEQVVVVEDYDDVKDLMDATSLGIGAKKQMVLLFDATGGKIAGTYALVDYATGSAAQLPIGAIITRSWYKVITTFTSSTDAATISLGIATDDVAGIKAAIAISNGANPYDAGLVEAIQTGTAANMSEITTAARNINATVAVEALTAGKLALVLEYTTF